MLDGVIQSVAYAQALYMTAQAYIMGGVHTVSILQNYGFYSNPPVGSEVVLITSDDDLDSAYGIADDSENRPQDLKSGECSMENTVAGTRIRLRSDGVIEILSTTSVVVKATESISFTSPSIILDGAIVAGGVSGGQPIARVGDTVSGGVITSGSSRATLS